MKTDTLWDVLGVFAPLSVMTIGGGQSILADLQQQCVTKHQWLTQEQFLDDFAISRAAPGPSTLIVTLIGWQVGGLAGALIASAAILLPSSVLFYGLVLLWRRHVGGTWQGKLGRGLAPVSVGLVLASSYSILVSDGGGVLGWIVTGLSMLAVLVTGARPFLLLGGGGTVFLIKALVSP